MAFAVEPAPGPWGRSLSLLSSHGTGVAVRAFKRAEEGEGWVLRLQELRGRRSEIALDCAAPITAATEVDGMEEPLERERLGGSLHLTLEPFQPRSLRLTLAPPVHRSEPARGRPVPLPAIEPAAGRQGRPVDFDGAGHSFPAELMPRAVACGGIELELTAGAGACRCAGQTVSLPEGDWQQLWLLACSVGGDRPARFRIDGRPAELTVGDWSEPLGCWRRKRWGRILPGTLKRHPVAFYATHRHNRQGADEPYRFCYLFRYALELSPGARELTLPDEPRVRLFALTLARGGPGAAAPTVPLYD
jgi:alpha-mannosidase